MRSPYAHSQGDGVEWACGHVSIDGPASEITNTLAPGQQVEQGGPAMAGDLHATVETLLVLLLVVFVVAVIVQRIRLPYTIALVLAGLFGFQPGFRHIALTPDLILTVFLPILLFEGAYNVHAKRLWRNILPVGLLAAPGVLICTLITAALVHVIMGLPWTVALLFGALIASTDPIAVVSLFRDLGVPQRLALLVEGESLFNDGAAITLFEIVLAVIVTGEFSLGASVLKFLVTVLGAVVIGTIIGYGGSHVLRVIDNPQIQLLVTVIAAYGSYLLADRFTFSGAIAVVLVGLFFGNYGATAVLSPRSIYAVSTTWAFGGFVANSFIFLLIGIELAPFVLARNWWPVLVAFFATLISRAVVVYLLLPLLRGKAKIPYIYGPVLVWGGLRGAVALALALSLPFTLPNGQPFPYREQLQLISFGVVAVSLVLQGLTMKPLIHWLGLASENVSVEEAAFTQARLFATDGALLALEREHERGEVGGLQYERLTRSFQQEHMQLEQQLQQLQQVQQEAEDVAQGGVEEVDRNS